MYSALKMVIIYCNSCCFPEFLPYEYKHSLQIPRQCNEIELAADIFQSAQRELPESRYLFDDADYRRHRAFTLRIGMYYRL